MKLYKLTNKDNKTHGILEWGENVTHHVKKEVTNPQLCSSDVIHAYKNINLALLLNPVHANYDPAMIWEAEGAVVVQDYGKVGCYSLTTIKRIEMPVWNNATHIRIRFAILCAEAVIAIWANKYPDDKRPQKAIEAAKEYLRNPSAYAADAAKAAYAAADAAKAAYAAADAAKAAYAANAAYAAAKAAKAAYAAADAAAYAAYAAAYAANAAYAAADAADAAAYAIDFGTLADLAVSEEANHGKV